MKKNMINMVIGNKVGDEGAKALSSMIEMNTTLKSLDLRG